MISFRFDSSFVLSSADYSPALEGSIFFYFFMRWASVPKKVQSRYCIDRSVRPLNHDRYVVNIGHVIWVWSNSGAFVFMALSVLSFYAEVDVVFNVCSLELFAKTGIVVTFISSLSFL